MTGRERKAYQDLFNSEGITYGYVKVQGEENPRFFRAEETRRVKKEWENDPTKYVLTFAEDKPRIIEDADYEVVESKITR